MEVLLERLTDIGAGLLPALGHLLLWVMALAGVLGSLFPAFPGATLIWGAAVAHGVVYGFDPLGGWTLGILTLLTGVSIGGQYVVGALGAKRFGASGWGAKISSCSLARGRRPVTTSLLVRLSSIMPYHGGLFFSVSNPRKSINFTR